MIIDYIFKPDGLGALRGLKPMETLVSLCIPDQQPVAEGHATRMSESTASPRACSLVPKRKFPQCFAQLLSSSFKCKIINHRKILGWPFL